MAVSKGSVSAGLTSFATSYPCSNATVTSFRSVGKFYVNGINKGWSGISSSEVFYCR